MPALPQIKAEFQDIVLSARQDAFFARNMYANFGDIGVAVKVCPKLSAAEPSTRRASVLDPKLILL